MELNSKILLKIQAIIFDIRMRYHRYRNFPAQTFKEMEIFKQIFDMQISKNDQLTVFEWGSGFSTFYYAKYLRQKGVDYLWDTVDNNRSWHEEISAMADNWGLSGNVNMYLFEFLPFWEKPGWSRIPPACGKFSPKLENELSYINLPLTLNKKYDIVIIDARFRRHCLQTTFNVLSETGIAIIHDAQKPHYHIGIKNFPYQTFIDTGSWYPFQIPGNQMWIGSLNDGEIVRHFSSVQ